MILVVKDKTKLSIESSSSFIEELQLILKAIQYNKKDSQFIYAENDNHIEYILNNEEVIEIFGEIENNVFYTTFLTQKRLRYPHKNIKKITGQ